MCQITPESVVICGLLGIILRSRVTNASSTNVSLWLKTYKQTNRYVSKAFEKLINNRESNCLTRVRLFYPDYKSRQFLKKMQLRDFKSGLMKGQRPHRLASVKTPPPLPSPLLKKNRRSQKPGGEGGLYTGYISLAQLEDRRSAERSPRVQSYLTRLTKQG